MSVRRRKGVVSLCEVVHSLGLISNYISDDEGVKKVILHSSHIQSEWSLPCDHQIITRSLNAQI